MFYGEYEHALDRKGRLIIPSGYRQVLREHYTDILYVTRGLDRALFLFPESEWRTQELRFRNLSFTKPEARRFTRLYFSGAYELTMDKQGRILIPKRLKEFAEIRRDVIMIGVSSRIEIWSREQWRAYYETARDAFESVAENLFESE